MREVTGARSYAGPRVVDAGRREEMGIDATPNGWFVGPPDSPDQLELLGPGMGGGEGIWWRARYHESGHTDPLLAVKQLRRPPGARADWPTAGDRQRWDEQKDLLQHLHLAHLATLIDIFVGTAPHPEGAVRGSLTPVDTPFVVMEWSSGRTLADEIGGTPATAASLVTRLTLLQQVAAGLEAVHVRTAYGTVGTPALLRDVKPENVVLDPLRGAVLVDVGTMRLVDDGYEHPVDRRPGYTAPEVLDRPEAPRDATCDLYSLGALAYFCVLGDDPPELLGGAAHEQLIGRRLVAAAKAAHVVDPNGFADHLRLMMHPQPDERPADATGWAGRLRALAARRGWPGRAGRRAPRTGARIAVATAVAVAGGVGLSAAGVHFFDGSRSVLDPGPRLPASGVTLAAPSASGGTTAPAFGAASGSPVAGAGPAAVSTPVVQDDTSPARITMPAAGGPNKRCNFIVGTSHLPPERTLVLAVRPIGGGAQRLAEVTGWRTPKQLTTWWAAQRFGPIGRRVGDRYRVDAVMVKESDLRRLILHAQWASDDWHTRPLPPSAQRVDGVTLTRSAGNCDAD